MDFVIADLEWNGAYSKKAHGYFNEIIEIGAVKLDSSLREIGRFRVMIRPTVTPKLSKLVTELTHISKEELEDGGVTFAQAFSRLRRWIGGPAVFLTWSTTDLLVLLENFRYYYSMEQLPFMSHYVDLQAYFQQQLNVGAGQQIGLSRAGEMLGIETEDLASHRALDDSDLTARILQKVYEPQSFDAVTAVCDDVFYQRITFKNTVISDPDDPRVDWSRAVFDCPDCGKPLRRSGKWKFYNRAFCAEFACKKCKQKYTARFQCRLRFEGMEYKLKVNLKKTAAAQAEAVAAETT